MIQASQTSSNTAKGPSNVVQGKRDVPILMLCSVVLICDSIPLLNPLLIVTHLPSLIGCNTDAGLWTFYHIRRPPDLDLLIFKQQSFNKLVLRGTWPPVLVGQEAMQPGFSLALLSHRLLFPLSPRMIQSKKIPLLPSSLPSTFDPSYLAVPLPLEFSLLALKQ